MGVACNVTDCKYNISNICTDQESILIEDMIAALEITCSYSRFDGDDEDEY